MTGCSESNCGIAICSDAKAMVSLPVDAEGDVDYSGVTSVWWLNHDLKMQSATVKKVAFNQHAEQ